MDQNQRLGFALLMLLFLGWYWFTAPTQQEIERQKFVRDSIEQVTNLGLQKEVDESLVPEEKAAPVISTDSVAVAKLNQQYGDWGSMMVGEETTHQLSNELVDLIFSSKGGVITKATMKEHFQVTLDEEKNEIKKPLELFNDKSRFEYIFNTKNGGKISTKELVFQANKTANGINFVASSPDGSKIEQIYTLQPNSYKLDYKLKIDGVKQLLDPGSESIRFRWHEHMNSLELNRTFEKFYSTIYFKENDDDNSDYCSCRSDDIEEDAKNVEWMAHTNQFFNTSIIAENTEFTNTFFEAKMFEDTDKYMKITKGEGDLALSGDNNQSFDFQLYIGPNEFERLRTFENGLDQVIPFGRSIFGTINRYVIRPAFNWLSKYIGSKGVVIIILIFILKMLLYPFMYKMLYSQAKMGALKPKLASLTEKFKDDPQAKQMETMKIYREYGVSPLGGCMPMILQMPIWYALFRFFPASITFRQEPFLWATDLSSFDVIAWLPMAIPMFGQHLSLFTVLWAISTVAYTYYNTKHMDMSANPAMKYVQYMMPIMFLVFFNNYASGLTCYMLFSNLFNILQTVITKKFVFNDEKILAELELEKGKPKKKKSGFQERLEEAMKQQQELQKKTNKKNQKKK